MRMACASSMPAMSGILKSATGGTAFLPDQRKGRATCQQERDEPPDIDFEHERREGVIQWIDQKAYGRKGGALRECHPLPRPRRDPWCRQGARPAGRRRQGLVVRHVVLVEVVCNRNVRELNLNPDDRRLVLALKLAQRLKGAPPHPGQHPGGIVLTHDQLDDLVPIEPATVGNGVTRSGRRAETILTKRVRTDAIEPAPLTCGRTFIGAFS